MKSDDPNYQYQYYIDNKERIKERQSRKKFCDFCNKEYKQCYWWSHIRSKKHIQRSEFIQI